MRGVTLDASLTFLFPSSQVVFGDECLFYPQLSRPGNADSRRELIILSAL